MELTASNLLLSPQEGIVLLYVTLLHLHFLNASDVLLWLYKT